MSLRLEHEVWENAVLRLSLKLAKGEIPLDDVKSQ
jgi:hypothetical protein